MRLKIIFGNIIALAMSVMWLVSCDAVIDTPMEECQPEETVTLSFRMLTNFPLSRTDNQGHEETDSELTELEDGIDMHDFGMFVFAKLKSSYGQEWQVAKLVNLQSYNSSNVASEQMDLEGGTGAYTVTMKYDKKELASLLGIGSFNPNSADPISFRVLIIANSTSTGTSSTSTPQTVWNGITGRFFSAVMNRFNNWYYNLSYLYNENSAEEEASKIYGGNPGDVFMKKNLPLFGMKVVDVSQAALYESRPDRRIYLGDVELLRGLAKVRVVDNIPKDEDGLPAIVAASFASSKTAGKTLPYDAVNYVNGEQVHTANLYQPDEELTWATNYKLGTIPESMDMTPSSQRTGVTRIGYVPEQKIGYANNDVENILPRYNITVRYKKPNDDGSGYETNPDGSFVTAVKEYTVSMRRSEDNEAENYVLRNHIYTLSIDGFTAPTTRSDEIQRNVLRYTIEDRDWR